MTYSKEHPPLHIFPADPAAHALGEAHNRQRRARDFFRFLSQHPDATPDTVMPTGQTVGEFCIWYIQITHARRVCQGKRARDEDE